MLQNLANKPTYAKEAYMITLNPFVENNKTRINKFLYDLCEVGDFYESLEVRFLSPMHGGQLFGGGQHLLDSNHYFIPDCL
jgi:hypothetical protein